MPQELRVVRCFQCLKYQVDIVKKANKWVCKMCGAKQSLAREYFRGTGKDCRSMVQQLSVRHLEMDQREAEVAELVLQNKIQLPQPPPEPVLLRNDTKETNQATSAGPSKWATFLTKEEDDPSDAFDASESLESVSSSTFDRERIRFTAEKKQALSGYPTVRRESVNADDVLTPDKGDNFPSINNWTAGQKKFAFPAKKENLNRMSPHNIAATKSWNQTAGNCSMELPAFHRKGSSNKRSFTDNQRTFAQSTFPQKLPKTTICSTPTSSNPLQLPCKRKPPQVSATVPMMNFGKRTASDSVSAEKQPPHNRLPQPSTTPNGVSSKWAKFLSEDDETSENTDSNFITF